MLETDIFFPQFQLSSEGSVSLWLKMHNVENTIAGVLGFLPPQHLKKKSELN